MRTTISMTEAFEQHMNANRRTPRRVFDRKVGLLLKGKFYSVQASDLSENGLMIGGPEGWVLNTHAVVSLIMPSGGVVVSRGELVAKSEPLKGMVVEIPEEDSEGPVLAKGAVSAAAKKPPKVVPMVTYALKFIDLSLDGRRLIRIYVTAKTETEAAREKSQGLILSRG